MTSNERKAQVPSSANDAVIRTLTSITTSLGGSVAFGLIASVVAPTIHGVAVVAAVVGLLVGFLATRLDKAQTLKGSKEANVTVVSLPEVIATRGEVRRRYRGAASEKYSTSWGTPILIFFVGLIVVLPLLVPSHGTAIASSGGYGVSFDPVELWHNMGALAKGVVIVLCIESIWSLAVIIDRYLYFNAAKKQSREYAPRVAGALKEAKLDEAIKVADRNKKSHLAEVVTAGLQEFRNYGSGGAITSEQIESSQRALERSEAIVHAKLKRGLGGLATVGSTAPFIGLFGSVIGIFHAYQQLATQKAFGIGAVAGGISEALVTMAFGLLVAILAVVTFNYFTGKVETIDSEISESSHELVDDFIRGRRSSR